MADQLNIIPGMKTDAGRDNRWVVYLPHQRFVVASPTFFSLYGARKYNTPTPVYSRPELRQ